MSILISTLNECLMQKHFVFLNAMKGQHEFCFSNFSLIFEMRHFNILKYWARASLCITVFNFLASSSFITYRKMADYFIASNYFTPSAVVFV